MIADSVLVSVAPQGAKPDLKVSSASLGHDKAGKPVPVVTLGETLEPVSDIDSFSAVLRTRKPILLKRGMAATIDEWLLADREAPPKQRHTAAQIFRRLVVGSDILENLFEGASPERAVGQEIQLHYTEHRGVPTGPEHRPFELTTHERYRQQRLRLEEDEDRVLGLLDGQRTILELGRLAQLGYPVVKKKAETTPSSMMKTVEREEARKQQQAEFQS